MTSGVARWRGQRGRVEVWYATITDHDGTGYWIHHEAVAPTTSEPYGHGWAAMFPVQGSPIVERFGSGRPSSPGEGTWFHTDDVMIGPGSMTGTAGTLSWDLQFADSGPTLWTFPRTVWERELLPGAQIVPWPTAEVRGTFRYGTRTTVVDGSGGVARIYGHGNAERWCWLHADLGDGAVLEIVAATPRRRGVRWLPLVPMVQVRMPRRRDWPAHPLAAAAGFRARMTPGSFVVSGFYGRRRLRVDVTLPAERCVTLTYTDPDGTTAECTNTEQADAKILFEKWGRGAWVVQQRWTIAGTAHAEVGTRDL